MKFFEFIKRTKVYWIIFTIILIFIASAITYGVLTQYDRGFLSKNGNELYYDKEDLPIQFAYTFEVPVQYLDTFVNIISELNERIGFKLLKTTMVAWNNKKGDVEGTINVLVDVVKSFDHNPFCGGTTIVKSDTRSENAGRILAVHIKMKNNLTSTKLVVAIKHEIGHALGLAHDDKLSSVMHNYTGEDSLKDFTESDINRLRKKYTKVLMR